MKKILAILALGFACTACSDGPTARRALDNLGLTNIEIYGWGPFAGCGENDTFVTRFRAKNANGKTVEGVVCSGWLKGATVRFY